eukprot:740475-Prorocentrum_minimum.AAC.1
MAVRIPRDTHKAEALELDLGHLDLVNAFEFDGKAWASGKGIEWAPGMAVVDANSIRFRGAAAYVVRIRHFGGRLPRRLFTAGDFF